MEVYGCACLRPRPTWGRDSIPRPSRSISISMCRPRRRPSSPLRRPGAMQSAALGSKTTWAWTSIVGFVLRKGAPLGRLRIRMDNQIPLGIGCGSSAAGRLAAIALAVHFGDLHWTSDRILGEASVLEGHPDNAAACWLGGFVAAACEGTAGCVARVVPPFEGRASGVLPPEPLATSKARAVLPASYTRADVVINLPNAPLFRLAFSARRRGRPQRG